MDRSLRAVRLGQRRVRVLRSELDRFVAAGATKPMKPTPAAQLVPDEVRDQTRDALQSARSVLDGGRRGDLVVAMRTLITATERLLDTAENIIPARPPDEQEDARPDPARDPTPYFDERR